MEHFFTLLFIGVLSFGPAHAQLLSRSGPPVDPCQASLLASQATTYTVTVTPPSGPAFQKSVTVTVEAHCCQQTTAKNIVELTSNYYGYNPSLPNTGDPFRDYPPGTYFHLAAGTVTLDNNMFQPPTGSVLLMDAGADLVLTDARLVLNGVTITAACDEMWGRVHELNNGHGIVAGPVQALRPRLMHSLGGLVQEDKLLNSSRLQLS
ncbi:hypothetical protein [Hymenobacter terricola]|uniref:hypothetical protein n=1 Tax=Hymenobacter terricola TaxID=2819236 RepID=UPI001B31289D|nr:hypothetical protein [Hymenobacter terricola]